MFQGTKWKKKGSFEIALAEKKWNLNFKYKWVMRRIVFYYHFKCLTFWICLTRIIFNFSFFHFIYSATLFLKEKPSIAMFSIYVFLCLFIYFFMCHYSHMNRLEQYCIFVANMIPSSQYDAFDPIVFSDNFFWKVYKLIKNFTPFLSWSFLFFVKYVPMLVTTTKKKDFSEFC